MSFSIIIPCYNCEKTLGRTLDSLLAQKKFLKQIILINDGSTDLTEKLAQSYLPGAPELIEYYYQENQGPAVARNKGAALVKGDYCLFLDADDTLTPDALKTFAETFDQDQEVALLIAGYAAVHGESRKEKLPPLFHTKKELFNALFFGDFSLPGGATALRSALLHEFRYPENLKHGEDLVFFSHMIAKYPSRTLPFVALNVYHHEDSLRHDSGSALSEGEDKVNLLFDPKFFSPELMGLKSRFHAEHLISLARLAVKRHEGALARRYLFKAWGIYPWSVFNLRGVKVVVRSII